ncbi:MAG: formylmethanofuran dehydrogenase subunit C [Candidatus Bathyarchaeia archaeon]
MRELRLTPKGTPTLPVEAETITPDAFAGRRLPEIDGLPVHVGNRTETLGEYFEVEGETAETAVEQLIIIEGDIPWVKYLGANMTGGRIVVDGGVGMHVGVQMTGGEITVEGPASDWAGAEMRGGLLRIKGDAGHLAGAAYRGSSEGMTGGCILVEGDAGVETGSFMRRGMIVVLGDVGPFAGAHMNGGEIFVFGRAARRLGAGMKGNGGIIVCLGGVEALLPTFVYDTTYRPAFMRLYMRELRDELGVQEAERFLDAPFRRYRGDIAVGGDGEILIAVNTGETG